MSSLIKEIEEKRLEDALKEKQEIAETAKESEERYPACLICHRTKEQSVFWSKGDGKWVCKECQLIPENSMKIGRILNIKKKKLFSKNEEQQEKESEREGISS